MKKEELLVHATTWINFQTCLLKETRCKRLYIILFYLSEIFIKGKSIGAESRWVVSCVGTIIFNLYISSFPFVFQWTLTFLSLAVLYLDSPNSNISYTVLSEIFKWSFSVSGHDVVSLWLAYSIHVVVVRIKSEKVCE